MAAQKAGYTHALTMDSDGQHPADCIRRLHGRLRRRPHAMILGAPVFDASAPRIRLRGRRIANWWTNLETLWAGIPDTLFGFRVYPIDPLVAVMQRTRWMRRFDFDAEAVGAPELARRAGRSTCRRPAATSRGRRAASRISTTGATTCS